jgi:hypothetical protein
MKSEVLTATSIQIMVELDMTRCNLVNMYQTAQCQIPGDCNQKRPVVCEPSFSPDLRFVHTGYTKEWKKNNDSLTSDFNPETTVI